MIDHLLMFDSEEAAKADSVVGQYCVDGVWRGEVCLPDVKVWSPADDQILPMDGPGGEQFGRIEHQYRDGWYINIAAQKALDELMQHKALAFVFDRDAANAGAKFVMHSIDTAEAFAEMAFEPVFAGSKVPDRINASDKGLDAAAKEEWSHTVFKDDAVVIDKMV